MIRIVYIPGLGDRFDPLRRIALARWKRAGTRISFVPMHWNDQRETYEDKYERIAKIIENFPEDEIVLVGESAGGAMALLAFSRNLTRVNRVVTICGYNHGAAQVHPYHKRKHPAFYRLMPVVDSTVKKLTHDSRERITTIYSTRDPIVAVSHSHIDDATEEILRTSGHFASIARILLRGPVV